MDYIIYPYEGVGPIRFGMTPEQVHEKLGKPEGTFVNGAEKGAELPFPTDVYDNLGLYFHYDTLGRCESVEFFEDGIARPTFQGQTLIGRTFGELESWMRSLKADVQHYDCGLLFLKFGISIYSEYCYLPHRDPGFLAEGVTIFSDYSDEIDLRYPPREEAIDKFFEEYDLCNVLVKGAEFTDYTIYPYNGVRPIRFGMTPEQVHEKLGEPTGTFMKRAESPFPIDAYDSLGFHVYYGESGRCEFVKFFESGNANPTFQGQTLFGRPIGELESWLQSLGTHVQYHDCGLVFLKFGISLYSENYYFPHQDTGCLAEAVGVFTGSYSDEIGLGYSREEAIDVRLEEYGLVEGTEFIDYIIYPYEGVGPIRFGMTPEQVHEKLGEPEDTTMKGAESPEFPTDAYHDLGLYVYYGKSGRCEAVDFFEDSSARPMFQGKTLISRPFGELKSWLQSLKTDVQHYDCGLVFLKFGINLYSQYYSPQDPGCLVEVVGIFASGYDDEIGIGYPREEAIDACFEECDLSSILVKGAEFMDYIIYPYEGIGPIRFGMTPEQVHEKLGEPERTTMKEAESPEFPTDAYNNLGFHVFYAESGRCQAVEFFEDGIAIPTFQGQTLIGRPFGELKSWLQSLETDVQHYDCGLIFLKFGINLYSQYYSPQDPGCLVETVGVSTSSYIDGRGVGYPREEAIP